MVYNEKSTKNKLFDYFDYFKLLRYCTKKYGLIIRIYLDVKQAINKNYFITKCIMTFTTKTSGKSKRVEYSWIFL